MNTVIEILKIIGLPTLCALVITDIIVIIKTRRKTKKQKQESTENDIELLKLGMQAQLRAQMISDYNYWKSRGYAPLYARDNFENVYQNYHKLGANGVMDDMRDKFFLLPPVKTIKAINKTEDIQK